MANNQRLFYAVEYVAISPDGLYTGFTPIHGVQSAGLTTNFNLDAILELGQLSIYENKETVPETQVTMQKVLDGNPLIYHTATQQAASNTLVGRSRTKCIVGIALFTDTNAAASGNALAEVIMSGMFVNSLSYTFGIDGRFTEDCTLVGNGNIWRDTESGATAAFLTGAGFNGTDVPLSLTGSGGVNYRPNLLWDLNGGTGIFPGTLDTNGQVAVENLFTILPPDIEGISSSGLNNIKSDGTRTTHVQSISVSSDLNRANLMELGSRLPYFRAVTFPTAVTCAITINLLKSAGVSSNSVGVLGNGFNLTTRSIKIKTLEGTYINLGLQNKLSSVDFPLGDTGGSNATCTYNYQTYNDFKVVHPQDPNVALRTP